MLDVEKVTELLGRTAIGSAFIVKDITDSTNLEIVRAAGRGACHGTVALAEQQTAGRGRRGRSWSSPPGENLYFSILLRPDFEIEKTSMLTLVAALAVAAAVRQTGARAEIKWPNDVVVAGKKICGILTELHGQQGDYFVLIGIGINVNQKSFPLEIREKATSLALEAKNSLCREALLAAVLRQFDGYYNRFVREGSLEGLREEYEKILANLHREVAVLDPGGAWQGVAEGITPRGELLVRRKEGGLETVYAGEVSVRGIYGYV